MPLLTGSVASAHRRIATLASLTAVHRAFHWLHLHQPQLRQWLLDFVRIPAPPFEEHHRAAWFLDRFRGLGLSHVHQDVVGNVLGELAPETRQSSSAPMLLLSAHLDTVFPAGTPCEPAEDASTGRLLAPGISDNGAGLSALLAIAAALRFAQIVPPIPILFAANVGEEGEGDLRGMRHLFEHGAYASRLRTAIALEGAGTSTVVDRALGSRRLRVTVTTAGGHSWTNFGAPNAILLLAELLVDLARIHLPQDPRTTLNVGMIDGGTSVNSIPGRASALLDLRSTDAAQLALSAQELETSLADSLRLANQRAPAHPAAELHLESIGDRPAATLPASSPLLGTVRAVDRHLNLRTEARIGSTDANLPLSLGLPAIAMSAGGTAGGVHTPAEWYDPAGREIALRRILLTVLDTAQLLAERDPPGAEPR